MTKPSPSEADKALVAAALRRAFTKFQIKKEGGIDSSDVKIDDALFQAFLDAMPPAISIIQREAERAAMEARDEGRLEGFNGCLDTVGTWTELTAEIVALKTQLAAERERCAQIAEQWTGSKGLRSEQLSAELATAIRDGAPRPATFVSASCEGETCRCGKPAKHKVEETILHDDPLPHRHPLTAYVCDWHFMDLMHGTRTTPA